MAFYVFLSSRQSQNTSLLCIESLHMGGGARHPRQAAILQLRMYLHLVKVWQCPMSLGFLLSYGGRDTQGQY